MSNPVPLLQVDSVSKRFPGVVALDRVSLSVGAGELVSVIGENGAGKSTLMKILAGIQTPDEGQLFFDGRPVQIDSVTTAQRMGIALIHQELYLCQNLDLGANIFLGREPLRWGLIDQRKIYQETSRVLAAVGLNLSPHTLAGDLTIGQQQMVEIAKAVSTNARLIIMDEPTSSLSQRESENLFQIIRTLISRGTSVVYISHRLAEVETLSHRVVTLRDGQNAGELSGSAINYKNMVEQMIGRELTHFYSRTPNATEQVLLSVEGLCTPANPHHPLQFHLRAGEIVGIAGLVGAGRTELLTTLFGVTPALAGNIQVAGTSVTLPDPQSAIAHGIALVPENRKQEGVILNMSVATNTSLPSLNRLTRWGLVHEGDEAKLALEMKSRLKTKTPHLSQPVKFLSGGNQQKVVIGKWLARGMKILLMDEPTRGVDVGARQEIYRLMDELAQTGVAILFVSSDLEEVLGMSDRMLVMHEGRIAGELSKERFSEQAVMNLATGNSALATAS